MSKYGNFVGSTYTSESKHAAGDRAVNLYLECIESGTGASGASSYLAGTPGYQTLVQLPDLPVRGIYSGDGQRVFAVAGKTLFEIVARVPPVSRLGYAELRTLIIQASGGTPGPLQTATQTAAQWAANYVTVTAENAPDPSTYGFGTGQLYATAALVTVDTWLPLFLATATYHTIATIPGLDGGGFSKVQMFANGNSLFIVAGAHGYVWGGGNTITPVVDAVLGAYIEGYFIALSPGEQQFFLSGLFDGSTWNGLDFGQKMGEADATVSILGDHLELWLFGQQSIEVYGNDGAAFPFERLPGGFIEQGCAAAWSPVRLDNTVFWLGSDERGGRICWKATGYTPSRVSNHAVEAVWAKYPTVADAEAFGYQDGGHSFYVIHFPSANPTTGNPRGATWVYDCAASAQLGKPQWHERASWDPIRGVWGMWRPRCHTYARGLHLVGDWQTGKVYVLHSAFRSDDGNPLRWLRSAPHISDEMKVLFFSDLLVDMQVGIGLNDDVAVVNSPLAALIDINATIAQINATAAAGPQPVTLGQAGATPQVCLRFSNDGGNTWSNERWVAAGALGKYLARVRWTRLGRARDRCYEVSGSDPVPIALISADQTVTPGNGA